jgi:hypothetical protein
MRIFPEGTLTETNHSEAAGPLILPLVTYAPVWTVGCHTSTARQIEPGAKLYDIEPGAIVHQYMEVSYIGEQLRCISLIRCHAVSLSVHLVHCVCFEKRGDFFCHCLSAG